ncbi:hypothetical protein H8S07_12960 [Dorea sp. NSJ-36]|uniref:Uncharacterized protein n=1 Tax=Dorea hominis TaxID=2763040 RepID=A0ABR7EXR7_9FIRM|nr:hypothetical protein [Dorea hominis]MBC5666146.1 hypothetical protein [Dorea hominis]
MYQILLAMKYLRLSDEEWTVFVNAFDQKYMEDLTDMQNHVLPYLQSFCSLEEKGVKERQERFEYMYRLFFFVFERKNGNVFLVYSRAL